MKYIITTALLCAYSFPILAQDQVISDSELPKEIKSYLVTHFPKNAIIQASVDKDAFSKSYDVTLEKNIKVEFDSKNKVKEIDGISTLPESVIPSKILNYVKNTYPSNTITDWESDTRNQQVKLDNGLELEFSMNGDFLRIDR